MKNILKRIINIAMTLVIGSAVLLPSVAAADAKTDICQGVNFTSGETTGTCAGGEKEVSDVIGTAINIMSLVVGVIAVIMVIIGGLKYITSSGDSTSISSAKNTIIYAIIGLVVVSVAQFIVRFVLVRVK